MKKLSTTIFAVLLTATLALAGIGTLAVTTTEKQIFPYDPNRNWVVLQNNDVSAIYIKASSDTNALTTANGIYIAPNGGVWSSARTGQNVSQNKFTAITATGTANLTYQFGPE